MNGKFSDSWLLDSNFDIFPHLGYSMEQVVGVGGLSRMASSCLKTQQELSSAKSSSPTQLKATIRSKTSTDPSLNISSDEALVACAQLKSLGGTIAQLRSQLNRASNVAYWLQHQELSSFIPSLTETNLP